MQGCPELSLHGVPLQVTGFYLCCCIALLYLCELPASDAKVDTAAIACSLLSNAHWIFLSQN
eukprot:442030-Amphidinium_carterae.1